MIYNKPNPVAGSHVVKLVSCANLAKH